MDTILMKDVSPNGGSLLENTAGNNWEDEFLSDDSLADVSQDGVTPGGLVGAVAGGLGLGTGGAGSAVASGTVITIAVVTLAVIIAIVGLFALAIFIDYRQQKVADQNKLNAAITKRKRYPRLNLPRCRRARGGDSSSITADAELPGHSRPPLETIVEVV